MVRIRMVDSDLNMYDPHREIILLDKKLEDYPEALQHIKQHELTHHSNKTESSSGLEMFLKDIILEFKTDFKIAFGNDKEALQVRQYISEVSHKETDRITVAVNYLRPIWSSFLYIIAKVRIMKSLND